MKRILIMALVICMLFMSTAEAINVNSFPIRVTMPVKPIIPSPKPTPISIPIPIKPILIPIPISLPMPIHPIITFPHDIIFIPMPINPIIPRLKM